MLNKFVDVLSNRYAQFDGRAKRKEFWLFWLVIIIFQALFFVLLTLVANATGIGALYWIFAVIMWIFVAAMLVPMLSLMVRRLHDIGRKGTAIFLALIPIVGGIWLFVLITSKSQECNNQFG